MNTAKSILHKQSRAYLSLLVKGIALTVIAAFVGVMLALDRGGETSGGKAQALLNLIEKIVPDSADPQRVMVYILIGAMGVVIIFGIRYIINGVRHMLPKNTPLGKSILTQAKANQQFADTLLEIDEDISEGALKLGNVYIGRSWIVETHAMRIGNIKGVFWLDGDGFILCCVDGAQNIWVSAFTYDDDRQKAIKHLRTKRPDAAFGDEQAYAQHLSVSRANAHCG